MDNDPVVSARADQPDPAPDPDLLRFVEDIGLWWEQQGAQRMAGRVLGWLLVSDPPHQSLDDLQTTLQASAGAISTVTRQLAASELIERVAFGGDRKTYYRVRPGVWSRLLETQYEQVATLRQLANRGLGAMNGAEGQRGARLREMAELASFWQEEFPALIERWNARFDGPPAGSPTR